MVDDNKEKEGKQNQEETTDQNSYDLEQIREEIRIELNNIDKNDIEALRSLAKKYKIELKDIVEEINNLRQEYERSTSNSDKKDKKNKIKERLKQLVKANELLREIPELKKNEVVIINKKADLILIGLADELAKGRIDEIEVAKTFDKVGEYLLGYKNIEFTEDSDFVNKLSQLQLESRKSLQIILETISQNPELYKLDQKSLEYLSSVINGRKSIRSEKLVNEMDEYFSLRKKISEAIDNYLKNNSDEDGKITLLRRYLNFDKSVSFNQIEDILSKLGLESQDLTKLNNLRNSTIENIDPKQIAPFLGDPTLTNLINKAINYFNYDNLIQKYVSYSSDGRPQITKENRIKLSKDIVKYYYLALEKVHSNNANFFERAKGLGNQIDYYLAAIRGLVDYNLGRIGQEVFLNDKETLRWLTDRSNRFQSSIVTYAEIFHDLPLYARDAGSFEKWPEFLGRLFPSELAEAFYGDPVMEISRSVITSYLRQRIYLNNGGKIPSDLFSREFNENEVRYSHKDGEEIKRLIIEKLEELKTNNLLGDFESWEVERAINYSLGIGLASMIDPELISTANPNTGDEFAGIYPLASHMSAKHNWGLGRGYPGANLIPELMAFDVTMFPEERGMLRFFKKKKWVPEFIRKFINKKVHYYGEKVWDELIDRDGNYQELLSLINIYPALTSRAGWRFKPLLEDLKKEGNFDLSQKNSWSESDWDRFYDLAIKKYGSTALWWWSGYKSQAKLENFLHSYFGDNHKDLELFKEGKALINIEIGGSKKTIRMATLRQIIENQVRGELFAKYLRRSPGDFFLIFTHMLPDLKDLSYFQDETGFFVDRKTLEEKLKKLNLGKDKKEEYIEKYESLLRQWGGEKFLVELGKVRKWIFSNLDEVVDHMNKKGLISDKELTLDKKIELFYKFLNKESLYYLNAGKLSNKLYFDQDLVKNPLLSKLLFSKDGLFNIVKNVENKDPSTRDLFYFIAQRWWYKEGLVNPFNSDINHFAVFQKLGKVGEDVLKRALGDAHSVSKMISEVGKLDSLLRHIAVNPNELKLDELYKIHETVFSTLKGTIGLDYANRANYIIAQIVGKFFWEHSVTRNTFLNYFPFGKYIAKLILGNKVSLSKLITGYWRAQTMDSNMLRGYFRKLAFELEVLPHEGDFSYEHLEREFDASSDVYFATEFTPNFLHFMIAFLIFSYIRKILEEDKKK